MFRCTLSPSQRLAQAIKNNEFETVKKILESHKELCNKTIAEENSTPLQIACRFLSTDGGRCLQYLLDKCDPEEVDNTTGFNALHVAVQSFPRNNSLSILISSNKVDVNSLSNEGDSVLHALIKQYKKGFRPEVLARYTASLKLLLSQKDLNVNHRNRKGFTAIYFAAEQGDEVTIETMLESDKSFDVDSTPEGSKSARVKIATLFPSLEALLPLRGTVQPDLQSDMFNHLYSKDEAAFVSSLKDISEKNIAFNVDAEDGWMSLMQTACFYEFVSVVECLLNHGGNPNATSRYKKNDLPSLLAAKLRNSDILQLLLANPNTSLVASNGRTALHALLDDSLGVIAKRSGTSSPEERRRQCFDLLMKQEDQRLGINFRDSVQQNTALHLATYLGEKDYIMALLKKGAYIGEENVIGQLALTNVPMDMIREFLDSCVNDNAKFPTDPKYEINYDYRVLIPPPLLENTNKNHVYPIPESQLLVAFSESDHLRPILKHPIFLSYISLKWSSVVRGLFYFNLCCYTFYMIVLNLYLLLSNSKLSDEHLTTHLAKVIFVLQIFLILRELLQFVVWPVQYLKNWENYLEISLIVVSFLIIMNQFPRYLSQLAAISILLCWAEFVLLLGKEPNLSVHLGMLKKVCKTFFQFLGFYSLILLAFALSFLVLSKNPNNESNLFLQIPLEIYNTIVMIIDYGDPKPNNVTFHLILLAFIFLVVIIVFNLLNGLAVSDTQKIKDNAELMGLVARVKILVYVEKFYLEHPVWCKTRDRCRCCCECKRWTPWVYLFLGCARKISLARDLTEKTKFKVNPKGSQNKSECCYRFNSVGFGKCSQNKLSISPNVIKETINMLLLRRNEYSQKSNLLNKIEYLEKLCHEMHKKLCS